MGFCKKLESFDLPKKTIKEFDDALRKIRPEWLGINHPQARAQLSAKMVLGHYELNLTK